MREEECAECRRPIRIGGDAYGACQGVLGMKRFIPLEELVVFCSLKCLYRYFDNESPRVPMREG